MYKRYRPSIRYRLLLLILSASFFSYGQKSESVYQDVTLNQAHKGSLAIDTLLLDSYKMAPSNVRQFYIDARFVLSENADADFTHPQILESARVNKIALMGGPMLGNLTENAKYMTKFLREHQCPVLQHKGVHGQHN